MPSVTADSELHCTIIACYYVVFVVVYTRRNVNFETLCETK